MLPDCVVRNCKWLHYQASTDNAFCHTYCKALIAKKVAVSMGNWEPSLMVSGFSNWKDATRAFKKHDDSEVHIKHVVEKLYTLPSTMKDIGESLNVAHEKEKQKNRVEQKLTKILSDAISEHLFFKIFLGGMSPDPPRSSMLCMLNVPSTL